MSFLENLGNGIAKVIDSVVERNHRASVVNRLRIVIKNERENTARAYVALGKYYFDNLRDPENEETERLGGAPVPAAQDARPRLSVVDGGTESFLRASSGQLRKTM